MRPIAGWSDFSTEGRATCLLLDQLAQRYGGRPSEWRRASMEDLSFDRLCMEVGREWEQEQLEHMKRGSVQPVFIVGGR